MPSVLTLSIEGDEVARLDLTENTEKAMTWVADGELELYVSFPVNTHFTINGPYRPADLEAIEFSLLREGAPAEVPTVVGTVLLTGHDLLVNGLDGITELFGIVVESHVMIVVVDDISPREGYVRRPR